MAELPFMMLWVHEHIGRTSHLDLAARGALMSLNLLCWITPGCRIPKSAAWVQQHLHSKHTVRTAA